MSRERKSTEELLRLIVKHTTAALAAIDRNGRTRGKATLRKHISLAAGHAAHLLNRECPRRRNGER